ncbi:hypothetical protein TSUD_246980 [Trifolium subterraneum]|uniref:B box-type domain-containing protein n=1 Tax=Trifolium subterraneum TaxID=3900 RepID=A0A2Z6NET0_TRISU|nr:hypothetical protein TSUD_246980 [Trifolium subterraneum]
MNSSRTEDAQQVQGGVYQPRWLEDFLGQKFFDSCPAHLKERNLYCINCKVSACKHCMSSGSHEDHQILRIYKNNYRDGVCLAAMQTHIDCSQIQAKAARKSSIPPIISIQARPSQESLGEISEPSKRKRKRKGTPHRAPLF